MADDPNEIYQANLDAVSRAVWDADMETALAHIAVPSRMVTPDADVTLEHRQALERALRELRDSMRRMGASAFIRICKGARFLDGDPRRIGGSHVTHILRGATGVLPPYESRMILQRFEDGWKQVEIFAHVSNRHITVISESLATEHRTRNEE
jgi:hypothetical protein